MGMSAIGEIANILIGSYVASLENLSGMELRYSQPQICIDMAGAILSVPCIEYGMVSDKALLINSGFKAGNQEIDGYIMLISEMHSFDQLLLKLGLGSCVVIVLYERTNNIAGLVHIMLPDSTKIRQNQNKLKFADTGIQALVEELEKQGLSRKNMIAKIAGGAKMFQFSSDTAMGNIGEKNVEAVREVLKQYGIKIVSEDVGLNYGRTIVFDPVTKDLTVVTAGKQTHII